MMKQHGYGFTLAELLISLAILGVIATFTIPKVLTANQNSKNLSIAKEAASTLSAAYQAYKLDNSASSATGPDSLLPYLNYVKIITVSSQVVDDVPTSSSNTCDLATCVQLHNGAIVYWTNGMTFGGTNDTNAIAWIVDPDPNNVGNISAVGFMQYFNGRLTSEGTALANTQNSSWNLGANNPARDPSWFSWS